MRLKPLSRWLIIRRFIGTCGRAILRTGKQPNAPARQLGLFMRWFPELLGWRDIPAVTCFEQSELWGVVPQGAGSQAMRRIMAIDFCNRHGGQYCHSPFDRLAHADREMTDFVRQWEQTFALGDGYPQATKGKRAINYAELAQFGLLQFYSVGPYQGLSDTLVDGLRQRYRKGKEASRNPVFTVALHIRRGDVTPDDWPELWVGIESHARTTKLISDHMRAADIPFAVQIFSQGKPDEFAQLGIPEAEFHLDADPFWTFDQLVNADLLVSTDSCFSHLAALLNDGIVISPDFGIPLSGWIRRQGDGSFDTRRLDSCLA